MPFLEVLEWSQHIPTRRYLLQDQALTTNEKIAKVVKYAANQAVPIDAANPLLKIAGAQPLPKATELASAAAT